MDYIDLVLIHWPGVIKEQPDSEQHALMRKQTYQQLEQFCEQGLIRSIGVSNYTVRHLEELFSYCKIKPAVNQIEVHPLLNQSELRNFCQKNDILVQAYSPLGSAAGVQQLLSNPVVNEIASQVSKTPAQVLIRWSLQVGCCKIFFLSSSSFCFAFIFVFSFHLLGFITKKKNEFKMMMMMMSLH